MEKVILDFILVVTFSAVGSFAGGLLAFKLTAIIEKRLDDRKRKRRNWR